MDDRAARIRAALDAARNVEALDLARKAAAERPDDAELKHLAALASARLGAIGDAERWLAQVDRKELGNSDLAVDVWSLAGRIAKARYAASVDRSSAAAGALARSAIDGYRRAFAIGGSAYPAVNAATMAMLAGDAALARSLAQQALSALGAAAGPDEHWHHATAGEARLVLGDVAAARNDYTRAHRLAGSRFGDIASMRQQLRLIDSADARAMLDAVPAPRVIAFSGHVVDRPGRVEPRFPADLEPKVAAALREKVAAVGPAIGYAQAACGADILFLEAMQDAGMQTDVVLPFARADFVDASVRYAGDAWVARFERVLDRATRTVLATEEAFLGDDVLFEHAANLIHGMAVLRARDLSTRPLMLTVLDPESPQIVGGTAATAATWTRSGGDVENIDLAALRGDAPAVRESTAAYRALTRPETAATSRTLKSLLFADLAGFSSMAERFTPLFVDVFLGTCKRILDALDDPVVDANTRGDGLFFVFERPGHAADFAVRLQHALRAFDWPAVGLPSGTSARIGLHTGPVFRTYDPVMAKPAYYGTHVNRTARLEPIVQPGQIFVTEAFAASLVADGETRFDCRYIGAMALAKQAGEARLYRLVRAGED